MFFTKNNELLFQFPFCSFCFICTVTKLHFELLKLNIKVYFHMCIWYNCTWLTVDMCCLSYWSVSKPYFLSLPVLLVFALVLSANRKGRCKAFLLHFVKTENWRDVTSLCHMGCLQWSTLCVFFTVFSKIWATACEKFIYILNSFHIHVCGFVFVL